MAEIATLFQEGMKVQPRETHGITTKKGWTRNGSENRKGVGLSCSPLGRRKAEGILEPSDFLVARKKGKAQEIDEEKEQEKVAAAVIQPRQSP